MRDGFFSHSLPDLVMNIIIVGAGGHARVWKQNIDAYPGAKLVGIVDTDTMKLEQTASWGIDEEQAFPSIAEAVRFSEEQIDVALITSPIPTHHLLAIDALQAGLNVILEKNMASTLEQGQAVVREALAHPELCTSMGTQYRFRPNWWTLRNLLHQPDCPIGPLSFVRFQIATDSGRIRSGWRAFLSDIFAEDMMVHHIDVMRYVTKCEIVKVQAQVFRPAWSEWLGSSSVIANFVLAPAGEERDTSKWIHTQYHGSWQLRGLQHDWENHFEFYGPNGSIRVEIPSNSIPDPHHPWEQFNDRELVGEITGTKIMQYLRKGTQSACQGVEVPKMTNIEGNTAGYVDQMCILDEMNRGIQSRGNLQPQLNFRDAFKAFAVTRAVLASSATGQAVWVPKYWADPVPEP
jgi:predicted dehydrogenase